MCQEKWDVEYISPLNNIYFWVVAAVFIFIVSIVIWIFAEISKSQVQKYPSE